MSMSLRLSTAPHTLWGWAPEVWLSVTKRHMCHQTVVSCLLQICRRCRCLLVSQPKPNQPYDIPNSSFFRISLSNSWPRRSIHVHEL